MKAISYKVNYDESQGGEHRVKMRAEISLGIISA